MQAHFKLIDSAKRRYTWLLDPNNPNLTPAQRKRAMHPTVSDYVKVLKMEMELYKRLERSETKRAAASERPTNSYTTQELNAMMRALAEVRHGLPPMRRDRPIQKNQTSSYTQTKRPTS
jgi:Zn-dependent oligopeptidase